MNAEDVRGAVTQKHGPGDGVRLSAFPEELRAVIEDTHDEPTLCAWLKLAGTRGTDEIAAAIRASRLS
jgi:hypothetical protein